ncbi:unnamed protein product [Litomosoides sigmodontis]|uniref:Uncharacterized protein n=1 Tax=Litomosoides sigmodontis TaxID=42156 RepID=A0A3P6S5G6_LITSI|nr:unnamed protein product [Litomosoides sigmodontis]
MQIFKAFYKNTKLTITLCISCISLNCARMTLRKKTPINGKVTNGIDVKIPPNLSHMFEKMTDQVLCREIIPELKRRATEYQQWIFDEQKKAEQILKDSGHMPPRIRTAINPWRDDFLNLLAAIDVSGGNDECSATDKNLCEHKVRFESNSSEHWKTKLSPPNDLSHLSTTIAEGVRDFCVRRTANALCRKRKMLETVADKTRNEFAKRIDFVKIANVE